MFLRDTFHTSTSIDEIKKKKKKKKTQWNRGMSYRRWWASVCHVCLQILLRKAGEAARLPVCVRDRADSNTSSIWHPPPRDHILKKVSLTNPLLI